MTAVRMPHTIETISGKAFDFYAPIVCIEDIATGLSNVCRFAGQTSSWYSVAEHSLLVLEVVREMEPTLALPALLHDGHEAYIGDLATPMKDVVGPGWRAAAAEIDKAIASEFGFNVALLRHPIIKVADEIAVQYEASIFKPGPGWEYTRAMKHAVAKAAYPHDLGLGHEDARDAFLMAYDELVHDCSRAA